jgi:tellurium resistance protein TerD
MAVSLQKGQKVSLSKEAPNLKEILVGLGWTERPTDGASFDLDASVFMVNADGKCPTDKHFIFYNNLKSPDGAVVHQGDNLTGAGEGDDEKVIIQLPSISPDIKRIYFAVTIHDAEAKKQNFGMISESFIRVVDNATGRELTRYDLGEDASTETAMLFGEVYLNNGEWRFNAIGQGYQGGLAALARQYGINV